MLREKIICFERVNILCKKFFSQLFYEVSKLSFFKYEDIFTNLVI